MTMPKIICHMIASVDGRLYPDRWTQGPDNADVTSVYETAAATFAADGWIVGRTTMAEYAESITQGEAAAARADGATPQAHVGEREGRPLAIVFDPKGKLRYTESGLPTGEHLVAVLSPAVNDAYLKELRDAGVSYVFAADAQKPLTSGLAALAETFGVKTLLLEGGGIINGAFLKEGLIDELSFLIYPAIDGLKGVSTIVDYPGAPDERPATGQRLSLMETKVFEGGVVWLHYLVQKA